MTEPVSRLADGPLTVAELRAEGIAPHDIDNEWMDDMTKRLFKELKRELSQLENAKPTATNDKEDAAARALNARTLDSLQKTLERMNRMEAQRADRRARKGTVSPAEAREELEGEIIAIYGRITRRAPGEGAE
jgi:hypothetical protein